MRLQGEYTTSLACEGEAWRQATATLAKHVEEALQTTAAEVTTQAEEGAAAVQAKVEQLAASTAATHAKAQAEVLSKAGSEGEAWREATAILAKQSEDRLSLTAADLAKQSEEGILAVTSRLEQMWAATAAAQAQLAKTKRGATARHSKQSGQAGRGG